LISKKNYGEKLKLWDAVMIVMGSMIGSGIFVSADIMRNLGSGYWMIVVWLITAVMTVAAISYGELSAMFPKAGGQYTYITEIFGNQWDFSTVGECLL
jgi:APA family basic amino acid/polyamine antiporter